MFDLFVAAARFVASLPTIEIIQIVPPPQSAVPVFDAVFAEPQFVFGLIKQLRVNVKTAMLSIDAVPAIIPQLHKPVVNGKASTIVDFLVSPSPLVKSMVA
jgi:hypothetical protein